MKLQKINITKKGYSKPLLELIRLDNLIVLNQTSDDRNDPFDPNASSFDNSNTIKSSPPSRSSNPFGGSRPDYEP